MQVVEHIEALNNLEEILPIPDVDGFIVGPRSFCFHEFTGTIRASRRAATLAKYQKMATAKQIEGNKFLVFSLYIFSEQHLPQCHENHQIR